MYQQNLTQSWENLVSDFITAHKGIPASHLNAGTIEDWYRVRAQRYRSLTYLESIAIDQQHKPDFAQELRSAIDAFAFQKRAPEQNTSPKKDLALAVAPGAVVGVASALLTNWGIGWPIAIGGVLMGAGVVSAANRTQNMRSKAADALVEVYAEQLRNYLPLLLAICEKHGIE